MPNNSTPDPHELADRLRQVAFDRAERDGGCVVKDVSDFLEGEAADALDAAALTIERLRAALRARPPLPDGLTAERLVQISTLLRADGHISAADAIRSLAGAAAGDDAPAPPPDDEPCTGQPGRFCPNRCAADGVACRVPAPAAAAVPPDPDDAASRGN